MKKLIIDNCPACGPVNRVIADLKMNDFEVLESKLEDYHFQQLYFKVNAKINEIESVDKTGFTIVDNFLVCDCHWSRIEFLKFLETETKVV